MDYSKRIGGRPSSSNRINGSACASIPTESAKEPYQQGYGEERGRERGEERQERKESPKEKGVALEEAACCVATEEGDCWGPVGS